MTATTDKTSESECIICSFVFPNNLERDRKRGNKGRKEGREERREGRKEEREGGRKFSRKADINVNNKPE
jgi:hypothetical protein